MSSLRPRFPSTKSGSCRLAIVCAAALLLGVPSGWTQDSGSPPDKEPGPTVTDPAERPGKYRLGGLYVTPRLTVGPFGFDSNVFYTATDRQPDVMGLIGPGLELVLPFGKGGRFYAEGDLTYLYFVKTASQRRLTGSGAGGLLTRGGRIEVLLEEKYLQTFSRPSYEIDERVEQTTEGTLGRIRSRLFGRLTLLLEGQRQRFETISEDDYLGTSLSAGLTRDEYWTGAELGYALSVKTAFVVHGEYQWNRYPLDEARSVNLWLGGAGFRTDQTALIAGHALAGIRRYQGLTRAVEKQIVWADVEAAARLSPRTMLRGIYSHDLQDAFFLPEEGVPALLTEIAELRLERMLTTRIDLWLYARRTRYVSDAPVTVVIPDEGPVTEVRNDVLRVVGADLGYRIRPNFRVGVVASYTDRSSTFPYFGIEGLLVGLNAQLNP